MRYHSLVAPATKQSILRIPSWAGIKGLYHGFTTRRSGTGRLVGNALRDHLGLNRHRPVLLNQVHGNRIVAVQGARDRARIRQADGAATPLPRTLLTIRTADCLPILAIDPGKGVLGAAHAGWRGISLRIPTQLVRILVSRFDCRPSDILIGLGPAIKACCYRVGEDVRKVFVSRGTPSDSSIFFPGPDGQLRLDLKSAAIRQLRDAGVPPGNLASVDLCTACRSDLLFSRRREGPGPDRMHAFITREETRLPLV